MVASSEGSLRHLESDIPLCIIASVTTSLIARKQGLASRMTAALIAEAAQSGSELSALGMFKQGYYSRLGFGTGPYEHRVQFDPSQLVVSSRARIPQRLTCDDYKDVHFALLNRWPTHGGVNVFAAELAHADMGWTEDAFGLGYRNANGELTHFIWGENKGEHGPLTINALAYQNAEQLLELLAMIKGLGDQVYSVSLLEPSHLQMQDLISSPLRRQTTTEGSEHEEGNYAEAFWQIRINNLESVLQRTHLPGRPELSFNLELTDPISQYLSKESTWQGISGDYTITLGENCTATSGHRPSLPLLKASAGGFSRLWLGCASATAISLSGEIEANQELLNSIERSLCLPLPKTGWEF
jgi:predicted acetyltransferase